MKRKAEKMLIYFDLTELFYAMSEKVPYYGIARTVQEVGYELALMNENVRFVIFSPYHKRFFQIAPIIDETDPDRILDLDLPPQARPKRLRRSRAHVRHWLERVVSDLLRRGSDQQRWEMIPSARVKEVHMDGKVLISLSQPRIISDYMHCLKEQGQRPRLLPMLHDLIPLHDMKKRKYNENFLKDNRYILENCEMVIANSEFTRDEILRFASAGLLPEAKDVRVVPLAYELRGCSELVTEGVLALKDYILCVGSMPGRKNLEIVLDAVLMLEEAEQKAPDIVLAGAYRKRVMRLIDEPRYARIRDKITTVISPEQLELGLLYKGARAVVLPSYIEGWGLPAAEALWLGTPAIVSDIPVMREVVQDLGLYFDPEKPVELAAHLMTVFEDESFYADLKARISQHAYSMRSWRQVAVELRGFAGRLI